MQPRIRKVAVLGSGVMGSAIAAHFANAGIPSLVLDIVPPDLSDAERGDPRARNRLADEDGREQNRNYCYPYSHEHLLIDWYSEPTSQFPIAQSDNSCRVRLLVAIMMREHTHVLSLQTSL